MNWQTTEPENLELVYNENMEVVFFYEIEDKWYYQTNRELEQAPTPTKWCKLKQE